MNLSIVLNPTNSTILQQYAAFTDHSPPIDVLRLICSFLSDCQDVVHFGLANRRLSVLLLSDTQLWNLFLHKYFPNSYAKHQSETEGLSLYKHLTNISNNIKTGKCHLITLDGHQDQIICMTSWGNKLVSASWGTIKIWNLDTEQEPQMLKEIQSNVTCMTVWNNKLIAGLRDETIQIWDLDTGQKLQTLKGHQSDIRCMTIWGNKLISGSGDKIIKVWDLNTGEELQTLRHQSNIRYMTIWGDKLVSGSWDEIKIWNLNTEEELWTLKEQATTYIECIMIWNDQLVCGLEHPWFYLWDLNTGQSLLPKLRAHGCGAYGIMLWNDKFVSISRDETVKIWDPNTEQWFWQHTDRNFIQPSCMTAVGDSKLATSSYQKVKIWDFNSPHLNHSGVARKPSKKRPLDDDECASISQTKRSKFENLNINNLTACRPEMQLVDEKPLKKEGFCNLL